ncbi:hypothetical protein ES703_20765 [subsurface metagenome]
MPEVRIKAPGKISVTRVKATKMKPAAKKKTSTQRRKKS